MNERNFSALTMKDFGKMTKPFAKSSWPKAIWQLINTLVPYILLWWGMIFTYEISYWLSIGVSVLAALFLVRVFIIFHDCGHQSFAPSLKANRIIGYFLGILVFTPSEHWWHSHAVHHATSGNLDKRGVGDVMTWTVVEYQQKTRLQRIGYRLFRSPVVMFILGPIYMFLISHRFWNKNYGKKAVRWSIYHNLGLLVYIVSLGLLLGWKKFILLQLPVIWLAGLLGIWLFFVQHQYQGVYWARSKDWDYLTSAIKGASYYRLPKIFQWFSGNIGFHQIHHLNPKIPNYELQACFEKNEVIQQESLILGMKKSLESIGLDLIDETSGELIRFKELTA